MPLNPYFPSATLAARSANRRAWSMLYPVPTREVVPDSVCDTVLPCPPHNLAAKSSFNFKKTTTE